MKMRLTLGFVLLRSLLMARHPADDNTADASRLIALENAWNQAQLHHDAKAVSHLVSDGFVYTDYDGTVMNKAAFLKDLKDPDDRASLIANDESESFHMSMQLLWSGRTTPREPTSASPSSTTGALPIPGSTRTTSGSAWPATPRCSRNRSGDESRKQVWL